MNRYIHAKEIEEYLYCVEYWRLSDTKRKSEELDIIEMENEQDEWMITQGEIFHPPVLPEIPEPAYLPPNKPAPIMEVPWEPSWGFEEFTYVGMAVGVVSAVVNFVVNLVHIFNDFGWSSILELIISPFKAIFYGVVIGIGSILVAYIIFLLLKLIAKSRRKKVEEQFKQKLKELMVKYNEKLKEYDAEYEKRMEEFYEKQEAVALGRVW
ncbi:hypothetical protein [Laceyella putida]|uniref:Uncharacterized protein n=1 Tax=Laceyella putida TaxID=110101 RepID=A0ABW2RQD1_9BACL